MMMTKHDPEMIEALNDLSTARVQNALVAGVQKSDDGPPSAVIVINRTVGGEMSALVLLNPTEVSEFAHSLLQASKEIFGTDEHEESKRESE